MKQDFFITGIIFFIISCANILPPGGGEKDTTPPKVLLFSPQLKTLNFKTNEIMIEFDEYIVKNNLEKEFFSSPKLQSIPEVQIKGKIVFMKIKEELEENTTYVINLDNCFKDLNEGNVLTNLKYVFSTGNSIDKYSLNGEIENLPGYIDTSNISNNIYTLLFENKQDSVLKIQEAKYIIKMKNKKNFKIENIQEKNYHVYFLIDDNNNLLYDKGEIIGFQKNNTIIPFVEKNKTTTIKQDTVNEKQDSVNQQKSNLHLYISSDNTKNKIIKIYNTKHQEVYSFNSTFPLDTIHIKDVIPSEYKIFVFEDENENNKWDSGDFIKKTCPEKKLYNIVIRVKENWNHKLDLNF